MPLKLSAGVSKKLSLPRYSSVGASCSVELELPHGLLASDPEAFGEEVRAVCAACRAAVDEQLARCQTPAEENQSAESEPAGHSANGNHDDGHVRCLRLPQGNGQPILASTRQMQYIRTLVSRIGGLSQNLLEMLSTRVCGKPLSELTTLEASTLIRTLQEIHHGRLDLATLLELDAP